MLKSEDIEKIKGSFYGWEYCVEKGVAPTITTEDIELLMNVFIDLEEQTKKVERYEKALKEIERWDSMLYSSRELGNFAKKALGLPTIPLND